MSFTMEVQDKFFEELLKNENEDQKRKTYPKLLPHRWIFIQIPRFSFI